MNEDANCPEGHVTPQKSILIAAKAAWAANTPKAEPQYNLI